MCVAIKRISLDIGPCLRQDLLLCSAALDQASRSVSLGDSIFLFACATVIRCVWVLGIQTRVLVIYVRHLPAESSSQPSVPFLGVHFTDQYGKFCSFTKLVSSDKRFPYAT